jgi:hypothetical protein
MNYSTIKHAFENMHFGGGGGGTCYSPPRRIAPKPSVSGIVHGVGMTPARSVGASACTRRWYGPKPLTTMVHRESHLVLQQG